MEFLKSTVKLHVKNLIGKYMIALHSPQTSDDYFTFLKQHVILQNFFVYEAVLPSFTIKFRFAEKLIWTGIFVLQVRVNNFGNIQNIFNLVSTYNNIRTRLSNSKTSSNKHFLCCELLVYIRFNKDGLDKLQIVIKFQFISEKLLANELQKTHRYNLYEQLTIYI